MAAGVWADGLPDRVKNHHSFEVPRVARSRSGTIRFAARGAWLASRWSAPLTYDDDQLDDLDDSNKLAQDRNSDLAKDGAT
jgi:hypothetical protein